MGQWESGTVRGHCAEPARPPVSFRYPYSRLLMSQLLSLMHHTRRRTHDVYTLAIVVFRPGRNVHSARYAPPSHS